jgi:hypothetical protein
MGYNVRGWYGIPMGAKPDLSKVPPKPKNPTGEGQPSADAAPKSAVDKRTHRAMFPAIVQQVRNPTVALSFSPAAAGAMILAKG